jgi:hypothetical protein
MKIIGLPRPNEQRKVEKLLVKLAKTQPYSSKPAKIRAESIGFSSRSKNFNAGLAAQST